MSNSGELRVFCELVLGKGYLASSTECLGEEKSVESILQNGIAEVKTLLSDAGSYMN